MREASTAILNFVCCCPISSIFNIHLAKLNQRQSGVHGGRRQAAKHGNNGDANGKGGWHPKVAEQWSKGGEKNFVLKGNNKTKET
jgi:hypothetical protein